MASGLSANGLPDDPGVYLMRNKDGEVIYVGKAKSLRRRVAHYPSDPAPKSQALVEHTAALEYIVTTNELEALILESNLIRKHRPRYNVRLKDDKSYPYVIITKREKFPRILLSRRRVNDGSLYYGPYPNVGAAHEAIKLIREASGLCGRKTQVKTMDRPCLDYHIGLCTGPCAGRIGEDNYNLGMQRAIKLLEGDRSGLQESLEQRMHQYALSEEFEAAVVLRDRIKALQVVQEPQTVSLPGQDDADVMGVAIGRSGASVQVLCVRGGEVVGRDELSFVGETADIGEVLSQFMVEYYAYHNIPGEIVLPEAPDDIDALVEWLRHQSGRVVRIRVPRRGKWFRLANMAAANANMASGGPDEVGLAELRAALGLKKVPEYIDAVDASSIHGTSQVGVVVSLKDGQPDKSRYRRYKMRDVEADDYAMIAQTLSRHYTKNPPPDLLLVDGGPGHVEAARGALQGIGIEMPVVGIAKRLEALHLPGQPVPIILPRDSPALHVVQRARDEAHRFAIAYHRKLRGKKMRESALDKVPGVGEKRRQALLRHFGSMKALRNAGVEEIASVAGIGPTLATQIHRHLRG